MKRSHSQSSPSTLAVSASSVPVYAVRLASRLRDWTRLEVLQLPSAASPELRQSVRLAMLSGRNLTLYGLSVLRLLQPDVRSLPLPGEGVIELQVGEEVALRVALLCRVVAPMRHPERTRACVVGISGMTSLESSYWFGMALNRYNPRRALSALRMLLTNP